MQTPAFMHVPNRCEIPLHPTKKSNDNVLSVNAIHRFSPPERLLQCTKRTLSWALRVTLDPLVIVLPYALEHLETTEVVEEAALTLDLDAALSHDSAVLGVDALCANDEERPEQEFVDAACDADL